MKNIKQSLLLRKTKKIVAFALSLCVIISVSGCSNTQSSDLASSASTTSSDDATAAVSADEETSSETSQAETTEESEENTVTEEITEEEIKEMTVQIGDIIFTASLEENEATGELIEMMQDAPITIEMSDYAGFEKVGSLGATLTTSNSQTTTQAGDIVLYNGNQIVVFYGSNTWSYTRLGHIKDTTGLEEALGNGNVTITFSIN
ncbi:MAG: hypothetical protein LIO41_07210 [Ruminococcus sp.]|nr:hypothetical protein [Ruminococcus sp.]